MVFVFKFKSITTTSNIMSPILSLKIILLLWAGFSNVESANILLSGMFGKGSHFLSLVPIGKSLVQRGHNVTFLISDEYGSRAKEPELSKLFNFEIFTCDDPDFSTKEYFNNLAELGFSESGGFLTIFKTLSTYSRMMEKTCQAVLGDQAMMKRFERLDAIVADIGWPCGALIKTYLMKHSNITNLRLIFTTPSSPHLLVFDSAGSPFNPAYQPSSTSGYSPSMTFLQRTLNTISTLTIRFFTSVVGSTLAPTIQKFDLQDHSHLFSQSYHKLTDLVLTSCDFAVEFPFPRTPNIIPVGGLTSGPSNPLPQELEDFMQSSGDDGVVIFSLGTYFASFTTSRPQYLKMFLDALGKIPQKVIIQLKVLPQYGIPGNIKALPWLPQNDLLGHEKTRLFVYQGGNNGFYEALYHGVPLVVIPFLGDQHDVALKVLLHGLGERIDKKKLSTDYIYQQISAALGNESHTTNAKRLSAIFRDRPMKPADRAAYWIEHVIKHGGEYMRSTMNDLSFIQNNLIDVFTFISLIIGTILYCLYRSFKFCFSCCCKRSDSGRKSKRE